MTNTRLVYSRDGSIVCEECKTIVGPPSTDIALPVYNNNNHNINSGRVVNSATIPNSSGIHQQQISQYSSTQNTEQNSGTVVDSK